MTFSDALPVQIFPASSDTYNEKEPSGVFRKCFCHPWKCSDTIKVEGHETPTTPDPEYTLVAIDSDDEILGSARFTELASGVFQASFTPQDEGICDEDIQLVVVDREIGEILSNPLFDSSLSPWTNVAGSGEDWSWNSGRADVTLLAASLASDPLRQSFEQQIAGTYRLILNVSNGDNNGSINIQVRAYNDGVLVGTIASSSFDHQTETTLTFSDIEISDTFNRLQIVVSAGSVSVAQTVSIWSASLKLQILDNPSQYPRTDCLNVKTTQDETVLITYSDNKNFASLQYSDISPDPEFTIRIPASFFHERFPEESEVIELSNSRSIQLNAQVKAQRQLEIGPMPYYMHRKMKLILKHQFVTIDDQDWVQSETYELLESNRRNPHKQARVWLDEKDYILRNVL